MGPRSSPGRRRVLALVTDGVQTGPVGPEAVVDTARDARARGVFIVTLALGRAPNRPLLSAISSGSPDTIGATDAAELAQAFRDLAGATLCAR
jgi:hypothetical protein